MAASKQATSRRCFVCGVENPRGLRMHFYNIQPGLVEAHHVVSEEYNGYPGVVHGGITAAMLDEVMGRVFMQDDPGRFMVTLELKVRYRRPVPVGEKLTLTGRKTAEDGRVGRAAGEIRSQAGELLAEGEIIVIDKPGFTPSAEEMEKMGWQVYPEEEGTR